MTNKTARTLAAALVLGLWAPAALGADALDALDARVSVDASRVVRTLDARLFGVHTAIWDAFLDTPRTLSALREMGATTLRFPGGMLADDYHWQFNTLDSTGSGCASSFANFAHVATNLEAQVFITVNYGSGTPEEAAAWVRCANVTNRFGFKYWEIGNENYGDWERDKNSPRHDPVTYARRAQEFFRLMKAADPTIKFGVVVTSSYKERIGVLLEPLKKLNLREFISQGYQGWTPKLLATLKQLGLTPDFVIFHRYPQNIGGFENDAELLQSAGRWSADAAALRRQVNNYFGGASTNIELLCTENNSMSQNPGKQTTSLVNALYLADSFGQIAQTEFKAWLWWDLRTVQDRRNNNRPTLYGWRPYGDHGMMSGHDTRYPTFYSFKLLRYFARGGDHLLRASSDHRLLAVYAARQTTGALALLVINKSPHATLKAQFSLVGYLPQAGAKVYSYGIPQDEAARSGVGSTDLATTTLNGVSNSFPCTFAPYSVTVIVLAPNDRDPSRMLNSSPVPSSL